MNGCRIHHTKGGVMHRVAITIFPETNQSYLLLSCLDYEIEIFTKLFQQLKQASINKLRFYLNLILPLYSENIVLSPELWNSWGKKLKWHIPIMPI